MLKIKIQKELLKMGYNPIHIGTKYLTEAIEIVYNSNKSIYEVNFEKDVYNKIATKYKKNCQTIKSNIIKATNIADYKNILENDKFNYGALKLTPKLVVWIVLKNIT